MESIIKKMNLEFFGTGQHKITPEKFFETAGAVFLDLRANEEAETIAFNFKYFDIEVVHIPFHELADRFTELPKDRVLGTFCSSGARSAMAFPFLLSKGFDKVKWIDGGYEQITPLLKPGRIFKKSSLK